MGPIEVWETIIEDFAAGDGLLSAEEVEASRENLWACVVAVRSEFLPVGRRHEAFYICKLVGSEALSRGVITGEQFDRANPKIMKLTQERVDAVLGTVYGKLLGSITDPVQA